MPFPGELWAVAMRVKDQTTEAAAWTAATVAERVEEAMETLKHLPGERPIGFRSTWPDIVRKAVEAYGYNAPEVRLPPPDNQRIDRALEVLDWMLWLRPKEIRLIFARGQGTPWRQLERRLNRERSTLHRWWTAALLKIAHKLNGGG